MRQADGVKIEVFRKVRAGSILNWAAAHAHVLHVFKTLTYFRGEYDQLSDFIHGTE